MELRGAWAEIDLAALRRNYAWIRAHLAEGAALCAVVKADAYGHGAVPCARVALECGARYLAVATVSEARHLREAGLDAPILMLGLVLPEAAEEIVRLDVTQAVADTALVAALSEAAGRQGRMAKVHLAIETGMGRIGVYPEDAYAVAREVAALPNVEIEGVFSHFAMADVPDKSYVREQLARFKKALAQIERAGVTAEIYHIAESAAALEIPEAHFDMVRSGIIQYGMMPSGTCTGGEGLTPILSLYAKVVFVKHVTRGETIGYGRAFTAPRNMVVATLPIGYADGYIRAYGEEGYVLLQGKRAKILGRICMDQTMVDVTDIPNVKVGDTATLIGGELTADTLAGWAHTIAYEVPCLLTARIPRVYRREGDGESVSSFSS